MSGHVKIKVSLNHKNGQYILVLQDASIIIKQCVDKFIVDKNRESAWLEGILQDVTVEYKSKGQLGYYFSVILPHMLSALESAGYKELTNKDVDSFLRKKFLTVNIANEITGEFIEFDKSLSSLFKEDMTKYIDSCRFFAQDDLNYYIPKPGEK